MTLHGGPAYWARRGLLAAVLAGAVLFPGYLVGSARPACRVPGCASRSAVRWVQRLPGSWVIGVSPGGTVPATGQAYVAAAGQDAVVGLGLVVTAYAAGSGSQLWSTALTGMPPGSAVVSVRAWPGVITAGVQVPAADRRQEVLLDATTGAQIRAYPAALYGGAVSASRARTVVVGPSSVTSYVNATGTVAWRDQTGSAQQGWRADGGDLYVTIAAHGILGTAPVTGVRQISLQTGAERTLRPAAGPFAGTLAGAADGVLLFSGPAALSGYSELTGMLLWRRAGAIAEMTDLARHVLYVALPGRLAGLDLLTGSQLRRSVVPGPPGLYGVRNGVALGLDPGAAGSAWGYDISAGKIVWSTRQLPWPHFFVDTAGIGGSADPSGGTVLLAACGRVGTSRAGAGQPCLRPELVAISR